MINKKYKWGYMVVILLCIAAMAAGAKYDYIITEKLYNPQNVFALFMEVAGWVPIYAFIPFWGSAMMIRTKNSMPSFVFGLALLIASCSVMNYMVFDHMLERRLIKKVNPYLCGIAGGLMSALVFFFMRGLERPVVRRIQVICSFAFAYLLSYSGVIFALKKIFGRDRYDDIITGGEYVFAEWFKPVFFSSGSSFPSGHTAAAMGVMVLLLFPFVFKPFKDKKLYIFIGCYTYVALMAVSRLIMGRHFLSDTAAAILVMTIVFIALTPWLEKNYRTVFLKEK